MLSLIVIVPVGIVLMVSVYHVNRVRVIRSREAAKQVGRIHGRSGSPIVNHTYPTNHEYVSYTLGHTLGQQNKRLV